MAPACTCNSSSKTKLMHLALQIGTIAEGFGIEMASRRARAIRASEPRRRGRQENPSFPPTSSPEQPVGGEEGTKMHMVPI